MTRQADTITSNAAGSNGHAQQAATTIWAWVSAIGDFASAQATRVAPDVYELLDAPVGSDFAAGDQVSCELSDGELVVRERIFRQRLV